MQIVQHRPVARGVSQLMYVGDSDSTDAALMPLSAKILLVAGIALWWLTRKR